MEGKRSAPPEGADLAQVIARLDDEAAVECFRALPLARRAEAFEYLEFPRQRRIAEALERPLLLETLELMCSDDRARFLRRLPPERREDLLQALPPVARDDVLRLISHPTESAGALMSTDYVSVAPELSVDDAIEALRRTAPRRELVQLVFVTTRDGRLLGKVDPLGLLTAPAERKVGDLTEPIRSIRAESDQEEAARTVAKYDLPALPVVDGVDRLLGVISADDAVGVLEEEQAEDVQLASGIDPEPIDMSYSDAPARLLVRKRLGWLLVLLVTGLISARVIAAFEEMLAAAVVLAFFIPVITGSGGNTGTQSATLIIRALATGDVSSRDWARVFAKEMLVGAALGTCLAVAIYAIGLAWPAARAVAPVVGATMIALVIWANLVGALLPLLLRRLRADPAVAGAPLVSTVVDATGLLIYFAVATVLMPG